ncbi:uncharacterized protein EI90DRAFT_3029444 [Cantharellus anzutake]|uniref:uncharacterized protein n=1 Tax=Cantharellus anzutake TaxID=1750568 RepID=UPI00190337D1|nr:uncharacterized protein EI90DRAFT_3029444 [Cantharellus anzutake]KAF8342565.1 hypothetical protein EI90DRAFT_3029444 [Cantharellus anzutake]
MPNILRRWHPYKYRRTNHGYRCPLFRPKYLLEHLDPLQLFLQESTELQDEFNTFIMRNLLTFMHLRGTNWRFPEEFLQFENHNSMRLLGIVKLEFEYSSPWEFYRSILPFNQSIFKHYGHLSDVRVFSILDKFSGGTISLSEDLLRAQMTMRAKLSELPRTVVDEWGTRCHRSCRYQRSAYDLPVAA